MPMVLLRVRLEAPLPHAQVPSILALFARAAKPACAQVVSETQARSIWSSMLHAPQGLWHANPFHWSFTLAFWLSFRSSFGFKLPLLCLLLLCKKSLVLCSRADAGFADRLRKGRVNTLAMLMGDAPADALLNDIGSGGHHARELRVPGPGGPERVDGVDRVVVRMGVKDIAQRLAGEPHPQLGENLAHGAIIEGRFDQRQERRELGDHHFRFVPRRPEEHDARRDGLDAQARGRRLDGRAVACRERPSARRRGPEAERQSCQEDPIQQLRHAVPFVYDDGGFDARSQLVRTRTRLRSPRRGECSSRAARAAGTLMRAECESGQPIGHPPEEEDRGYRSALLILIEHCTRY